MVKKILGFSFVTALVLPLTTFAVTRGINDLIAALGNTIGNLIPVVIGLALLLFLWGILRYMFSKDDTAKGEARNFMLWGIIALFVMVSVWGLVGILQNTIFGGGSGYNPPAAPTF